MKKIEDDDGVCVGYALKRITILMFLIIMLIAVIAMPGLLAAFYIPFNILCRSTVCYVISNVLITVGGLCVCVSICLCSAFWVGLCYGIVEQDTLTISV